jgi:hypothetical protein
MVSPLLPLLPRPARILSVISCGDKPWLSSCVMLGMPVKFFSNWSKVSSEQKGSTYSSARARKGSWHAYKTYGAS